MNGRILTLAAVLIILPSGLRMCNAAPPAGTPWKMTFSGEFPRQDVALRKWTVKSRSPPDRSEAEVLRDNVEIDNGMCRLLARKGDDGRTWKTPQLIGTGFEQRYGYFEARIKISKTTGLANVFALIDRDKATDRMRRFWVEVVNAHYPSTYLTRVRMPDGQRRSSDKNHPTAVDLSKDYHLYGLEWNDEELIWYFDDREVRRLSHTLLRHPARIQLVIGVDGHGGKATEVPELPAMQVDYVRVYKKLDRPPKLSDWHDGMQ